MRLRTWSRIFSPNTGVVLSMKASSRVARLHLFARYREMRPLLRCFALPMKVEWKIRPYFGVLPFVFRARNSAFSAPRICTVEAGALARFVSDPAGTLLILQFVLCSRATPVKVRVWWGTLLCGRAVSRQRCLQSVWRGHAPLRLVPTVALEMHHPAASLTGHTATWHGCMQRAPMQAASIVQVLSRCGWPRRRKPCTTRCTPACDIKRAPITSPIKAERFGATACMRSCRYVCSLPRYSASEITRFAKISMLARSISEMSCPMLVFAARTTCTSPRDEPHRSAH